MIPLTTLVLFAACSPDVVGPEDTAAVSAAVSSVVPRGGVLSLPDSTLVVGSNSVVTFTRGVASPPATTLSYRSRDTTVVRVDEKGNVSGVREGSAYVVLRAVARAIDSVPVRVVTKAGTAKAAEPKPAPLAADSLIAELPLGPRLGGDGYAAPELPRRVVDVTVPRVTGRTIRVPAGNAEALRRALADAVGGDEIVLPNGSEFTGSFTMPVHAGAAPVILRSESVPAAGRRVTPSSSRSFARLVTTNSLPALKTAVGARGWHVIGLAIELRAPYALMNYGIVTIGTATEASMADFASRIVLDRVYVAAGEESQTRRCVGFNGIDIAVVNSWLAECHSKGFDTQAVAGWTAPGPFLIENNHMEASGEHVVFGGGDPRVTNVSPSDITIRRNYMFRPMSWANGKWLVKNIFELKHARRVLFEANVLENNWANGQAGVAIMLTPISQGGKAPWTTIQDLTIRNNVIKNSTSGITMSSRQLWAGMMPTEPAKRILLENNLMLKVGNDPVSGARGGRYTMIMGDIEDFTMVGNTFLGAGAQTAVGLSGSAQSRLTIRDNVFGLTTYGVFGGGSQEGLVSLKRYALSYDFVGNVMTGRPAKSYPAGNATPASLSDSEFLTSGTNAYTLSSRLDFARRAGRMVGVNGADLSNATAGVIVLP